jgi:hypothetical protein
MQSPTEGLQHRFVPRETEVAKFDAEGIPGRHEYVGGLDISMRYIVTVDLEPSPVGAKGQAAGGRAVEEGRIER